MLWKEEYNITWKKQNTTKYINTNEYIVWLPLVTSHQYEYWWATHNYVHDFQMANVILQDLSTLP